MAVSYADKIRADRERVVAGLEKEAARKEMSAEEIAEMLRPDVVGVLQQRVRDGDVGTSDLIRLLGMLNDRIDGKVADKVEHSGNVTIAAILAEVSGTSTGLPRLEDIEQFSERVYDDSNVPALTADVADGLGSE